MAVRHLLFVLIPALRWVGTAQVHYRAQVIPDDAIVERLRLQQAAAVKESLKDRVEIVRFQPDDPGPHDEDGEAGHDPPAPAGTGQTLWAECAKQPEG